MTYHVTATKQTTTWHYSFKLALFKLHPPLNFFTAPNWLTVKLYYFLISPKVEILNIVSPLAAN